MVDNTTIVVVMVCEVRNTEPCLLTACVLHEMSEF